MPPESHDKASQRLAFVPAGISHHAPAVAPCKRYSGSRRAAPLRHPCRFDRESTRELPGQVFVAHVFYQFEFDRRTNVRGTLVQKGSRGGRSVPQRLRGRVTHTT